jgi:peptidoglycan hydrolase CwlO-like protein
MEIKEAVLAALKELIVPELQIMKQAEAELKTTMALTNKRLDDLNAHLVDQSRRIDEINKRIDETNNRIDRVHADLIGRIDETNKRIDETNRTISRLYEVIVRREEHTFLTERVARLEQSVEDLKKHLAA